VVSSRLFSHALCGLVVLAVSVTPGVVSSWFFSHALPGLVVLGEWWSQRRLQGKRGGSVERDNTQLQSIARNTTGYLRSTRRTTPVGLPSFPHPPNRRTESNKSICSKEIFAQESREQSSGAGKRSTTLGRGEARYHPFFPSCCGMVKVRRHRSLAPVSLSRCHWDHRQGRGVCRSRDVACDPGLLPGGSVGVPGSSEAL